MVWYLATFSVGNQGLGLSLNKEHRVTWDSRRGQDAGENGDVGPEIVLVVITGESGEWKQ